MGQVLHPFGNTARQRSRTLGAYESLTASEWKDEQRVSSKFRISSQSAGYHVPVIKAKASQDHVKLPHVHVIQNHEFCL